MKVDRRNTSALYATYFPLFQRKQTHPEISCYRNIVIYNKRLADGKLSSPNSGFSRLNIGYDIRERHRLEPVI